MGRVWGLHKPKCAGYGAGMRQIWSGSVQIPVPYGGFSYDVPILAPYVPWFVLAAPAGASCQTSGPPGLAIPLARRTCGLTPKCSGQLSECTSKHAFVYWKAALMFEFVRISHKMNTKSVLTKFTAFIDQIYYHFLAKQFLERNSYSVV